MVRVRVKLSAFYRSSGREFETTITSLSRGGLFLYAINLDPVGTPVKVAFDLPDQAGRIEFIGEVIYSGFQDGLRGLGIGFRHLRDEAEQEIRKLMSHGTPIPA